MGPPLGCVQTCPRSERAARHIGSGWLRAMKAERCISMRFSLSLSSEVRDQLFEELCAPREARVVVAVKERQAADLRRQPRRLGTRELAVLQVDVVNQLGERAQPRHIQREASAQHLER